MGTVSVILLFGIVYAAVIFLFLRFFGFLSDRDAEIRKLLTNKTSRRNLRSVVHRRRLKLAAHSR